MDSKLYPPRMAELEKGYKLVYGKIHEQLKRKWFQYTELFFIVGSIASIIYSSFEISAPFRAQLFLFNYIASFVFTIEYALRLISAPMQYPDKRGWQARLKYVFSFYGIIDFVAILPFVVIYTYQNSPHLHLVVLAYILIIFKLIRYSRSFRLIGEVLHAVREELVTAYTACGIMLGFSGILMIISNGTRSRKRLPTSATDSGGPLWLSPQWATATSTPSPRWDACSAV